MHTNKVLHNFKFYSMVGAGGSAQAMADSLKNNRSLLSKRTKLFSRESRYKRLRGQFNEEVHKSSIVDTKKITYEQRKIIRKKIARQNRIEKFTTISIIVFVVLIAGYFFWSSKIITAVSSKNTSSTALNSTQVKFYNYMKYGDT